MTNRKAISKKIRFEVFKRDKFTCQYCGLKAPDIVLQIDHIDPVAGGGDNEISNLLTSCFDCNNGKRDRKLDDNSVVEKQRRQLEILQERREQIELMLEWKKSLANFDNDVIDMIVEYIDNKISPLTLNENGKQTVTKWLKKFATDKILDGIDDAAKQYLKFDDGNVTKDSAEHFLEKVGGVIVVKGMPPVKQKIAYIKGIARNRFSYWDERKGAIILNYYVEALKTYGWSDETIADDLEKEVIPKTKECSNWSEWKSLLEGWTDDVKSWETAETKPLFNEEEIGREDYSAELLDMQATFAQSNVNDLVEALTFIGRIYPHTFDEIKFKEEVHLSIISLLSELQKRYKAVEDRLEVDKNYINAFIGRSCLLEYFNPDTLDHRFSMQAVFEGKIGAFLSDIFCIFYFPLSSYKRNEIDYLIKSHIEYYEDQVSN